MGMAKENIGPLDEHPHGKLSNNDDGGIKIAIGVDGDHNLVRIDFGKPVAWVALDKKTAISTADALRQKANELRD